MEKATAQAVLEDIEKRNTNPQIMYHIASQVDFVIKAVLVREDSPLDSSALTFQIVRTYDSVKGIFLTPVLVQNADGNYIEIENVKTNRMADDILSYTESQKTTHAL